MDKIGQEGLSALSPGQLGRLAVSPMLLLELWDALDGQGLSPYWLGVVRSSMQEEERTRGTRFPTLREMVARAKSTAQGAPIIKQAAGSKAASPSAAPLSPRWEVEVPLTRAEWLSRDDPAAVDRLVESEPVVLEFIWRPGESPRLEVWFSDGPLTLPGPEGARTAANLMDDQGREFAAGRLEGHCLVFDQLPPGGLEGLAGATFRCTYSVPGSYALKIVTPARPPGAEAN
jgi:hypothetical protein